MKVIYLNGPQGNAYYIIEVARQTAEENEMDADAIIKEMTAGSYGNLLNVVRKYFKDHIFLYEDTDDDEDEDEEEGD